MDGLHDVEGRAEHGFVFAKRQDLGSRRIDGVEFGEDAEFAAHIMSGFYFAAKRRAAKDEFPLADFDGVGEIRMAAGKLADD
jgi:hypothetical protein